MRYLGIDYGTKRIGLAVSDENAAFAFPEKVIDNASDALSQINDVIREKEVGEIVIGESLDLKGKENEIMDAIHAFKEKLEAATELLVHFENEVLTSAQARRQHGEEDAAKGPVDASAAALILQGYLDRKQHERTGFN